MEQKTIGKFITALRKANGMTQKELAERLNVSDKTVSRWERDEGAPDLSVIPVIAEIFGVTCDELLRGERKPEDQRINEAPTPKGKKQRQRILTMSLSRYRNQSFITVGISAVGLIAAMIGNLGFNRAYIGFLVGAVFFVASLVCQAIFANGAFLSISDEELAGAEIEGVRASVIELTRRSVCTTLVLLGATIPLIVFPSDTYWGLEFWSWVISGAAFAAAMRLVCGIIWFFVYAGLLKKGVCTMEERQERLFWQKHRLKSRFAVVLLILLAVTFFAQFAVNEIWGGWNLAQGTEFQDYDSFVAFMEQDVPYRYVDGSAVSVEPPDGIYYDEYGNEISEEEAWREELIISDGTPEGKVVCTFIRRNHSVVSWSVSDTDDGLPITVKTQADYDAAEVKSNLINMGFVALYLVEVAVTIVVYLRKRRNLC